MSAQDDLMLAIGRLEGKVDSILATMRVHHEELKSLDERVSTLEHHRSWILGGAAAISLLTAEAVNLFNH